MTMHARALRSSRLIRRLFGLSPSKLAFATALFITSATAPAVATHPLLLSPASLKNVALSVPVSLKDVVKNDSTGLDLESQPHRAKVLEQAREYAEFRKGSGSAIQIQLWKSRCDSQAKAAKGTQAAASEPENPFCRYEIDRATATAAAPKLLTKQRETRRKIADEIRAFRLDGLAGEDYSDVVHALSTLGDAQSLVPLARRVADSKKCQPSNVTTAIGSKMEELFPNEEMISLVKTLYSRSNECGQDAPAATAAFRLGLIQIWQRQCDSVQELMRKTESVSGASQFHSRAKFWRFYCANINGNEGQKQLAKESLLKEHPLSFQNLAANGDDSAFLKTVMKEEPSQVSFRSLIRPDLNPALRGAEALIKIGSNPLAVEMLERNIAKFSGTEPEVRLYTAVLLNRLGHALPKFRILSTLFSESPQMISRESLQLMFPLWYVDLVKSKQDQVDPLLILSLIRQESAFNKNARSIVGARGLMQVMPATARMVASVSAARLSDPEVNVGVGTKYFLKRLGQYDGDVELTLAAYNAGFGRVDQWLKRYPTDNKHLFLDFIPFKETREYVSSILRNYYFYTRLYSLDTQNAAPLEGLRLQNGVSRVQAIMSANAGWAAAERPALPSNGP